MAKIMKIRNDSGSVQTALKEWAIDEEYIISEELRHHFSENSDIISLIENEDFTFNDGDEDVTPKSAIATLKQEFNSSLAVDKSGTDQSLSGTDWILVTANSILWDIDGDYDADTDDFLVPYDGIYFYDGQIRIVNMIGVTDVELALFKRGDPDDYWFILDKKEIVAGHTTCQLSAGTSFDFYEDERYCLKIKLYGLLPSAEIDGDDDYTSWGVCFQRSLHG